MEILSEKKEAPIKPCPNQFKRKINSELLWLMSTDLNPLLQYFCQY